jgi:hypothetical protein
MEDFALRYGETWQAWDAAGFLALFHEEIVYIARPEEMVRGIDELARYFRKEQETQGGAVRVRMGRPTVQGSRVIAEFWTTSVGQASIAPAGPSAAPRRGGSRPDGRSGRARARASTAPRPGSRPSCRRPG